MAGDGTADRLAGVLRDLREASGLTFGDIIRLGTGQAVKFTQASLSNWFDGTSVPSDPKVFRALLDLMDTRARKKPGYTPKNLDALEQLRRAAQAQRRPRRTAAARPEAHQALAAPAVQQAPTPQDEAKASRLLKTFPQDAAWLRSLKDIHHFPIRIEVSDAFDIAAEQFRRDIFDFVDPDLRPAHRVLVDAVNALEPELDGLFGPDRGRPYRDATRHRPRRQDQIDEVSAARTRFGEAYVALVNLLNRKGLVPLVTTPEAMCTDNRWRKKEPTVLADPVRELFSTLLGLVNDSRVPAYTLPEVVGMSASAISSVVNGLSVPRWEDVTRLLESLGVDPADVRGQWEAARAHQLQAGPEPV